MSVKQEDVTVKAEESQADSDAPPSPAFSSGPSTSSAVNADDDEERYERNTPAVGMVKFSENVSSPKKCSLSGSAPVLSVSREKWNSSDSHSTTLFPSR